jgi:hypothetical protein
MKSRFLALRVLNLILVAWPVHAATPGLLAACKVADDGEPQTPDAMFATIRCMAYLDGMLDMAGLSNSYTDRYGPQKMVCPPESGVSIVEVVSVVAAHARRNPDADDANARAGVVSALARAYPCQ